LFGFEKLDGGGHDRTDSFGKGYRRSGDLAHPDGGFKRLPGAIRLVILPRARE
jgi:hypothetical protein